MGTPTKAFFKKTTVPLHKSQCKLYLPNCQLHRGVWDTHTHTPHHPENDVVSESQMPFIPACTSNITIKIVKKNCNSPQKQVISITTPPLPIPPPHRGLSCVPEIENPLPRHLSLSSSHGRELSARPAPLPADAQEIDKPSMPAKSLRVLEALCINPSPSLSLSLTQHEIGRPICVRRIHQNL